MTHASTYRLLTSAGPAAIAVLQLRGPAVGAFMERHVHAARRDDWLQRPGSVFRGELRDAEGEPADDILVSVHTPAPNAICSTKTIEANAPDCEVRLHLHANPLLVQRCSEWLRTAGFEEFAPPAAAPTGAALWDAQDGLDAEAWARLPQMQTERGARWLLGQAAGLRSTVQCWLAELQQAAARGPDVVAQTVGTIQSGCAAIAARYHAVDWFARPLRIALIGPPNAGKSTLANALADRPVSLVSAVPGTTRDWVEAPGEIEGFPVVWVDTAGLRASADPVEVAAGAQTRRVLASTAVVVVVLDGTVTLPPHGATSAEPSTPEAHALHFVRDWAHLHPAVVALNKADLARAAPEFLAALPVHWRAAAVIVSARDGSGLVELRLGILAATGRVGQALQDPCAFSERQRALLAGSDFHDAKSCSDNLLRILYPSGALSGAVADSTATPLA